MFAKVNIVVFKLNAQILQFLVVKMEEHHVKSKQVHKTVQNSVCNCWSTIKNSQSMYRLDLTLPDVPPKVSSFRLLWGRI